MTHENKFGMFIHWGVYALTGLHEQAIARYDLDREYYEGLSKQFDPVDYDPEAWVLLAKKAGIYGMIGGQVVDVKETGHKIDKEVLDFI